MWPWSNFGELIPIWNLPPVVVGFIVFGIDFGMTMLIRIIVERNLYFTRWWTFKVGDTLGLPVYAGFAAVVIKGHEFSGIYTELWFHLGILILGYVFWTWVQKQDLKSGLKTRADMKVPSERYHTFIFGVMLYLLASVFIPVVIAAELDVSTVMAFTGLGIYAICFVIDQSPLVDRSRPYRCDREEG